jgi:hypothetical protein
MSIFKTTIVVVYKKSTRSNSKVFMKIYKNRELDVVLMKELPKLGSNSEILELGMGSSFETKYKRKYKLT